MDIYQKLFNNSIIFAIGNLGVKLISLLLLPLYTFYLSPSQFGTVDIITITVSLFIPVFTLSIINSILRFVMDKNYDKQSVLINSLIVASIGFFILLLAFPLVSMVSPIKEYTLFFYSILFIQIFNSLLAQFVRANGFIKLFAINGIITALVLLLSNLIFIAFLEMSIYGYFISFILAYFISSIFLIFYGNIIYEINFKKVDIPLLREMLFFSIPLIPNTLMWWLMGVSDRYLVTYYLGLSAAGLYAVAVKIPSILNIVNTIFFQAWQMSAIEEADSKDKSAFYTKVFNVFSILMLALTSLILVFLKPVMSVIVSDVFYESWKYIPFLLLGVVFSSFSGFLGTNYIAAKKTGGVFKTSLIGGLINIILNIILIPLLGINGAALATMVSFFIVWILRIKDTKQFVTIKINKFKLFFVHLIIFMQIFILYSNFKYNFSIMLSLFVLLIIINIKDFKLIFINFRNSYRKKMK